MKQVLSTDHLATRFPVSVKGVIVQNGKTVLLKNERDEWELPGGKLEAGEDPIVCVEREISEELGLKVRVLHLMDAWLYNVNDTEVLILTYECVSDESIMNAKLSHEHKELDFFNLKEVGDFKMPAGYKKSLFSVGK